jgi:DNA-binding transcriptional LysR family regulator
MVSFPRDGGEIGSIPWQDQQMVLVVSADHRLAKRKSIRVAEIEGEDFVGFRSELAIRKQVDRWLRNVKVVVNVVHEFDNIENIKRAVEIGSGVAILPVPTVGRETETGSLAAIPFSDVNWSRPLGVIHRRHKTFTTPVTRFVELLNENPEAFPRNAEVPPAKRNGNGSTVSVAKRSAAERCPAEKHRA